MNYLLINATLLVVAGMGISTTRAQSTWTVTNLHPAGATRSGVSAVSGDQAVGYAAFGGPLHAGLWHGSADSWVDLHPLETYQSWVITTDGTTQAGCRSGVSTLACLWNGTADSWVNLHPANAMGSSVCAIHGNQQAGRVTVNYVDHASVWNGTAESWVSLNPANSAGSIIYATTGAQQVGYAHVDLVQRASLWNGTAASWVDLHPVGASVSIAYSIFGNQQGGVAQIDGTYRASLWHGTGASRVDLHPASASGSYVFGLSATHQAGWAQFGNNAHASLWTGTAASRIDLHAFTPTEFVSSEARAISVDGPNISVAGFGYNALTGRTEALLWTYTPCPADLDSDGDFANGLTRDGAVDIDDLLCFLVGFEVSNVLVDLDNGTGTGTRDNAVDINDLLFFLVRFEEGC